MRERAHFRVDQPLYELVVDSFGERTAPVAVVGPGNGTEVGDSLTNVCYGDLCLRIEANFVKQT